MAEVGDIVMLKSGGPEMVVFYILKGNSSRDKAAELKGFATGDMICEWQQKMPNGKMRAMRQTFKVATLKNGDGSPLGGGGGGGGADDDDDDW